MSQALRCRAAAGVSLPNPSHLPGRSPCPGGPSTPCSTTSMSTTPSPSRASPQSKARSLASAVGRWPARWSVWTPAPRAGSPCSAGWCPWTGSSTQCAPPPHGHRPRPARRALAATQSSVRGCGPSWPGGGGGRGSQVGRGRPGGPGGPPGWSGGRLRRVHRQTIPRERGTPGRAPSARSPAWWLALRSKLRAPGQPSPPFAVTPGRHSPPGPPINPL